MKMENYRIVDGVHFHKDTSDVVCRVLLDAMASGRRVRLWLGDTATGRAWAEENDVFGTVGRSCGPVKVPLLVEPGEDGGGHMLDHCIVRIDVLRSRQRSSATTLYQHPAFHVGSWSTVPSQQPGYAVDVMHDGEVHARFRKPEKATAYVQFMTGQH